MARGLCDGLDETVVAFQLVSVSTGAEDFGLHKRHTFPLEVEI